MSSSDSESGTTTTINGGSCGVSSLAGIVTDIGGNNDGDSDNVDYDGRGDGACEYDDDNDGNGGGDDTSSLLSLTTYSPSAYSILHVLAAIRFCFHNLHLALS